MTMPCTRCWVDFSMRTQLRLPWRHTTVASFAASKAPLRAMHGSSVQCVHQAQGQVQSNCCMAKERALDLAKRPWAA